MNQPLPADLIPGAEPWSHDGGPAGALVLHGFTGSHASWTPIATALREHRRVIAIDLPGHGATTIRSRAFEWQSDSPVDFNIHYHQGDKVTYPVKANKQREGKGRFTAAAGEDYCWMWSTKFPARITGRLGPEE